MNALERKIYQKEAHIGLSSVDFEIFESALKRYGYKGQISEEEIKEISREINLNFHQLDDKTSYPFKYYLAQKAFYKGRFNTEYLLVLGFLKCYHKTNELAEERLWGILDPEMKGMIKKQRLEHIISIMLYYSAILPWEIQQVEGIEDSKYKAYINELKEKGEKYLLELSKNLSTYIYQEQAHRFLPIDRWLRTFQIRRNLIPSLTHEE